MRKGGQPVQTSHDVLRKLRAAARALTAGLPVDFSLLLSVMEPWELGAPQRAKRISVLVRGAEAHLTHRDLPAALSQLRHAIDLVEEVRKRQTTASITGPPQDPSS